MNKRVEVGDTVRLVRGNSLFSDPELQEDFVVQTIKEEWIEINGFLIPVEWFEIMKGKDDPELREVMDEEDRLTDAKDRLWDYVHGTDLDGLSDRMDLARFLIKAKLITEKWNA